MRFLALLLLITACQRDETLTAYGAEGTWRLSTMDDQAFLASATIAFSGDGKASGTAPCNSYSAQQTAPYPWFALSPILATKRACEDLEAEQAYFSALTLMTLVEVSGDVLILSSDAGATLHFTKQPDG